MTMTRSAKFLTHLARRCGHLPGNQGLCPSQQSTVTTVLGSVKSAAFFSSPLSNDVDANSSGIEWKERKLISGTTQEQFFNVVSDVNSYAEFVPYVVRSREFDDRARENYKEAELEVGFSIISEKYTSKIEMEPHSMVTTTTDDSRLFSHLTSRWRLSPGVTSKSVWVDFEVEFGFKSPVYDNLASVFLEEVVKKMMGAFEERGRLLAATSK
jgi:coenzyme Q-binding protein COQ10